MQSAIANAQLRKTNVNRVEVDLKQQILLESEQNKRLRDVDIESWYENIKDFTYPTIFVPLSMEEAQSLIKHYFILKKDINSEEWKEDQHLSKLYVQIQEEIIKSNFSAVFAKLSSRSPKDSRLCQQRARELSLEILNSKKNPSTNEIVQTIMKSGIQVLKMNTVDDLFKMFLTSNRVCEDDLPLALQFPDRWSQHIIIREWIDIPIQFEFRAFVYDNKLTAVSQYFNNAYFPELIECKEKILKLIQDLFDKVSPIVGINPPEYVLDIGVLVNEEKAYVIELNPFGKPNGMGTGTCLFDNSNPTDLDILFGNSDFEFRLEEKPTEIIPTKYIRGEWKDFLHENNII